MAKSKGISPFVAVAAVVVIGVVVLGMSGANSLKVGECIQFQTQAGLGEPTQKPAEIGCNEPQLYQLDKVVVPAPIYRVTSKGETVCPTGETKYSGSDTYCLMRAIPPQRFDAGVCVQVRLRKTVPVSCDTKYDSKVHYVAVVVLKPRPCPNAPRRTYALEGGGVSANDPWLYCAYG